MSDRELLERAAKAYWDGEVDDVMSFRWSEQDAAIAYIHGDNQDHNGEDRERVWNPLTDDGDALRLAVRLKMSMVLESFGFKGPNTWVRAPGTERVQYHEGDPCAATRRAIVRAAAAIDAARAEGEPTP